MLLNHLFQFYEVARVKSFSQAAKHLRISQPGLSKTVKNLEQQLGVVLLDRRRGGTVEITPLGREVLIKCERIFGEVNEIRATISREKSEISGALRLAVSDNLANYVMPGRLKSFLGRYPRIVLQLFTGTATAIQHEITLGASEIGVFYTPIKDPALDLEKLTDVEFLVVSQRPLHLDQLSKARYIGSRSVDYETPYPALKMLHSLGITPSEIIETNNQEVQKRLAMHGYGYTLLPSFMAQAEITNRQLYRIRTRATLTSPVYLVTKSNRTLSRPAEMMAEHIRKSAQSWFNQKVPGHIA